MFEGLILYPLSLISKYFEKHFIPLIFFISFSVILYYQNYISITTVVFLFIFSACAYLYSYTNKVVFLICVVTGILLAKLHLLTIWPGFNNLLYTDAFQKSPDCIPYKLYINYDIAFVTFPIWYFFKEQSKKFSHCYTLLIITNMIPILMVFSLLLGFVRFDPIGYEGIKLLPVWCIVNLFYTCFSEELLFRGIIQHYLSQFFRNSFIGTISTSLIFGMIHFKGGIKYIILSFIAGLFYGYIYEYSGKILYSIKAHFFLNLIHFVFFSYPYLAHTI